MQVTFGNDPDRQITTLGWLYWQ